MKKIAAELLAIAKELTAAAGPYTLLEQVQDALRSGKLEDDHYLELMGHGFGHTKGADYIYGEPGSDIVYALIGYASGHKSKEEVLSIIKKNINQALKDNEPFRGLRGEQMETHDLWMKMMKQRKSSVAMSQKDLDERYVVVTSIGRDPSQHVGHIKRIGDGKTLCGLVGLKPVYGSDYVTCGICERAYKNHKII